MTDEELLLCLANLPRNGQRVRVLALALKTKTKPIKRLYKGLVRKQLITRDGRLTSRGIKAINQLGGNDV